MTGLDKILKEIQLDAENKVSVIISDAENTAKAILDEAERTAQNEVKAIEEQTETAQKEIMERAKSAGEKAVRQAVLLKKREVIDDTLAKAKKQLLNLPDEEYFAFLTKILDKSAHNEAGEILLSQKDRERLSTTFREAFTQKGLTLSDRDIPHGGFVLLYGDIEEKCTFDALFEAKTDTLSDIVVKTIFN